MTRHVRQRAIGGMTMRTFLTIIVFLALSAAPSVLVLRRAHAEMSHTPAWIVECPGVTETAVYKSGWFTYSQCRTERPVSFPSGCTWIQIAGC
jgi:hypothetical protein